jgi:hypothetical protein
VCEKPHGSISVPQLQRRRLVLALAMRPLDLENRVPGRDDKRDVPVRERFLQLKVPLGRALLDERRETGLPGSV